MSDQDYQRLRARAVRGDRQALRGVQWHHRERVTVTWGEKGA